MSAKYVLGLDFGSDSVRALVVNTECGEEVSSAVSFYRRWREGKYCVPSLNQFRQHPLDYLESMEEVVNEALKQCSPEVRKRIAGIGVDTTGSTPCAVNREGIPLALLDEFKENPNAMFILWKDHTAVKEAAEINERAWNWGGVDYTRYEGGVYSSEWFWAKILHVLREDEKVREAAFSWVEQCDWIPAVLTGQTDPLTMKRSRCTAGLKAMWHEEWNGLPSEEFLSGLDPLLAGLRERLYEKTYTTSEKAGNLTAEWAKRLRLPAGIPVAVGSLDGYLGAIGAGIRERALVMIMGTSICHLIIVPHEAIGKKIIRGICGQIEGSVIPGYIGLEAGQSSFGDVYAWFRSLLSWPLRAIISDLEGPDTQLKENIIKGVEKKILGRLTEEAEKLPVEETGPLALDWLNGRRTPFADQALKGAIIGLNLATTAPAVFRALVEATAFGTKAITEHFIKENLEIEEVIAVGGIPRKNNFVIQVITDVLNMPVKVAESEEACALGAGITAAVAAGIHGDFQKAIEKMASPYTVTCYPDKLRAEQYQRLYERDIRGLEKI